MHPINQSGSLTPKLAADLAEPAHMGRHAWAGRDAPSTSSSPGLFCVLGIGKGAPSERGDMGKRVCQDVGRKVIRRHPKGR